MKPYIPTAEQIEKQREGQPTLTQEQLVIVSRIVSGLVKHQTVVLCKDSTDVHYDGIQLLAVSVMLEKKGYQVKRLYCSNFDGFDELTQLAISI